MIPANILSRFLEKKQTVEKFIFMNLITLNICLNTKYITYEMLYIVDMYVSYISRKSLNIKMYLFER